jgi:hypothetical protein
MITTHTRKTVYGFCGFVQAVEGKRRRSISTRITRLTREDAKRDADALKRDIEETYRR